MSRPPLLRRARKQEKEQRNEIYNKCVFQVSASKISGLVSSV